MLNDFKVGLASLNNIGSEVTIKKGFLYENLVGEIIQKDLSREYQYRIQFYDNSLP